MPCCTHRLLAALGLLALLASTNVSPRPALAAPPPSLPDKTEPDVSAGLDRPSPPLDRSTPRRSWSALLEACRTRSAERGQHLLNLGDVPVGDRKLLGPVLAGQLCQVLSTSRKVSPGTLEDTPLGPLTEERPSNVRVVAVIPGAGAGAGAGARGEEEIWLRRFRDAASGQFLWLLTRKTVSQIPAWYRERVKKETSQRSLAEQVNTLGSLPDGHRAETPRAAMQAFVEVTDAGHFLLAAGLLDLSQTPVALHRQQGARLARRLAIVLRRIHPGGYAGMSNDQQGAPERDVPFDEERVARATIDGQSLEVHLARYPRQSGAPVWLFSASTVADIDALYARFGHGWPGDHLPLLFLEWQLLGVQLWQWIGLGLALAGAVLLGYFGALLLRRLLRRLTAMTRWSWDEEVIGKVRGPLWIGFAVLVFVVELPFLSLASGPSGLFLGGSRLFAIVALGWFLVRIVDGVGAQLFAHFKERNDDMGMAMVPVARKILKPIIVAIIAVVALQNLGMNVGGLLAGLGIGGLAIALAGKNTLENLFGSIVISFDRPFRLGDFVKVGDLSGTVEDLGLRSTRLRTLDRTLVTIPNAQLADSRVENFSRRDRMRLFVTLSVQYDTAADQLRFIVDELKRYLLGHPRVWQESFSVRFVGFGASSLNIDVNCWVATADWNEFTGIREAMLLELAGVVERAGAVFAFPSQTVYNSEASRPDPERARQAEATVAWRRQAGELTLPDIPETVKKALQARSPDA